MRRKQKVLILFVIIFAFVAINKNVLANTVIENTENVLSENSENGLSDMVIESNKNNVNNIVLKTSNPFMPYETISKKDENDFVSRWKRLLNKLGDSLPSRYLTENLTIKNQGTTSECWAFAFTSAFEAYNIKKEGKTDLYSPRHVDYSCSKSFTDVTDVKNLFNRETAENGGNYFLANAYATSGKGPVLEADMPFSNDVVTKISYSELDKEPKKQLDISILIDSIYKKHENGTTMYYADNKYSIPLTEDKVEDIRYKIKSQISNNGGVAATIFEWDLQHGDVCIKDPSETPTGSVNHGILIVGWDDDYIATGWDNPGAYIAMNTYGVENFDNGYIYISYDDIFVEAGMYGVVATSNIDFDSVYEYDPFGATSAVYSAQLTTEDITNYSNSEISAVNVFSRDSSKKEKLSEIGVSLFSYQKAEVYFTQTFDDDRGLPINFKKVSDLTSTLAPGFTTIKFDVPVVLTGDKFAICVRFVEDNEEGIATVAIEARLDGTSWWDNVTGERGETYFVDKFDPEGSNLYWTLNTRFSSGEVIYKNASIKAYTSEYIENDDEKVIVTSSEYMVFDKMMITRVPAGDTISDFKSKISVNKQYVITDKGGKIVTDGSMKTGYILSCDDVKYEISVIGDISGDGIVNILDLARMRLYLIGKLSLTGVYWESADLKYNGKVDILDLAVLRVECLK